ncbi:tRNA (adenine(58)-N(1))-methyltransferase non-catalytic subunit trm6 [Dinochytrium kinnereticum]|nr:tRNA (adenine(58)-N(1))-methyltransferase non-catalytic subunit trm6 [Dinochytrium kinnereticum]
MAPLIKAGDFVIIRMPSSNMKLVQLNPSSVIDLGKFGSFLTDGLFGNPANAEYEIGGDKEVKLKVNLEEMQVDADSDADNSGLVDCPTSQQLSHMDIEQMKEASLTGKLDDSELIKTIVDNSKTFEKKTGFAKQKYIKRKQKKFSKSFHALETSAHNLCEFYFSQKAIKISELRVDTLSQMLSLANVHSGSKYLVIDGIKGLLAGAVMERMGGPFLSLK